MEDLPSVRVGLAPSGTGAVIVLTRAGKVPIKRNDDLSRSRCANRVECASAGIN